MDVSVKSSRLEDLRPGPWPDHLKLHLHLRLHLRLFDRYSLGYTLQEFVHAYLDTEGNKVTVCGSCDLIGLAVI